MSQRAIGLFLLFGSVASAQVWEPPPDRIGRTIASIDLATPFATRAPWRFVATQGPAVADPLGDPAEVVPGVIRLCISPDGGRTCRPSLDTMLRFGEKADEFTQPHFLQDARIVRPRADLPLLLIRTASTYSGDGDQRIAVAAYRYDRAQDAFVSTYHRLTGHNNNQEIRYVAQGALRGAIVTAAPTQDAPFGFWMTVDRIAADGRYRQVLRYRSATRYNDGNPLGVIDSEMPSLQQRLGLWHPGMKLPVPDRPCPAPRLVKRELWCGPPPR